MGAGPGVPGARAAPLRHGVALVRGGAPTRHGGHRAARRRGARAVPGAGARALLRRPALRRPARRSARGGAPGAARRMAGRPAARLHRPRRPAGVPLGTRRRTGCPSPRPAVAPGPGTPCTGNSTPPHSRATSRRPPSGPSPTGSPAGAVDPARVVALVVGVERCAAGSRWTLPGPVRDALRFRDRLRSTAVPGRWSRSWTPSWWPECRGTRCPVRTSSASCGRCGGGRKAPGTSAGPSPCSTTTRTGPRNWRKP